MARKKTKTFSDDNPNIQAQLRLNDMDRIDRLSETLDFSVTRAGMIRAAITALEEKYTNSTGTKFEVFVQKNKKSVSLVELEFGAAVA